jgi:hypothetical protein
MARAGGKEGARVGELADAGAQRFAVPAELRELAEILGKVRGLGWGWLRARIGRGRESMQRSGGRDCHDAIQRVSAGCEQHGFERVVHYSLSFQKMKAAMPTYTHQGRVVSRPVSELVSIVLVVAVVAATAVPVGGVVV